MIDAGRGYGRACALGAVAAPPRALAIAFMDGDGADRGDLIGEIVRPVLEGTQDLVLASRTCGEREPGAMLWHQVSRRPGRRIRHRALYGVKYSDMCAFRAISRDAFQRLGDAEMTYGWNIEMQMKAARAGLRIREVPLPYRCRGGGSSKVAGSLRGTLRAGSRIAATFCRVAASTR